MYQLAAPKAVVSLVSMMLTWLLISVPRNTDDWPLEPKPRTSICGRFEKVLRTAE